MTAVYLLDTATAPFVNDPATNLPVAVVRNTPQGSNWWAPKFLKVSVQNSAGRWRAAVYLVPSVGTTTVSTNNSYQNSNANLFVDSTDNGLADVTGLVSGLIVNPGGALETVFRPKAGFILGSNVGATAVVQVYGTSYSYQPGPADNVPEIIGPHFNGKPPSVPFAPTAVQPFQFNNPGPGNTVNIVLADPPSGTSSGSTVFLFEIGWLWSLAVSASAGAGDFEAYTPSGTPATLINDNPGDLTFRRMSFGGISLDAASGQLGNGIRWHQTGTVAVNTTTIFGSITFAATRYAV